MGWGKMNFKTLCFNIPGLKEEKLFYIVYHIAHHQYAVEVHCNCLIIDVINDPATQGFKNIYTIF